MLNFTKNLKSSEEIEDKEKIVQNIIEQLDKISFEEAVSIIGIVNLKLTIKLINAEVKRIHVEAFKTTYPPELWTALQEKFSYLRPY